ncbi:hypothetical protein QYE76_055552 [Lolium multiflorum]|uniref:Uncharacterized protein n=1 Tax=Lolium multiflorum TaxID=4521 RepID=A0AAD8SZY5_LOLMU|nr:hypothetical protein QYE76_055552 [Lolium multiflorum]
MVKKKNPAAAASSTSGGAAAKSSSSLPKGSAPNAPPPAPAPPAPPSSMAKPGDWIASTVTKRDEKRSRSLGLISSDEGNVIFPAMEATRASPVKRSAGGFADEDDLFDIDEGIIEPPSKKAKSGAAPPDVAASEASAPKATPTAQASTASSLSKGKDVPSAAAAVTPPSDLRGVISSLEAFASQFTSLEAEKVRLQEEVKSSSSKLDGAIKKAATARQEVDSLKEELGKLKERLKEEEARSAEKDELLRQSSLALLEAANIPAAALDKVPNNSPANGVSMALASHQLTRELLEKGKGALARMHLMIFPKIKQDKTLGQLIDAFAVDTKEVIEVFKRTSRTYGALLAFQLMMGYGFKGDIEEMTKELPKEQDGQFVFPVPSFVDDSSGTLPEGDRIQRMKDRVTQMEKDLRSTYALAAIVNKKSEIAAEVERYALTELHKATECLSFPEQVTRLRFAVLRIDIRVQVARGVDLLSVGQFGSSLLSWFIVAAVPRVVPITVLPIVSSIVISIILPIRIPCGYQVFVVIVAVLPSFVTIPSAARVVLRLVIVFVVTALSWPSHVVLAISPTVGDFH